MQNSAHFLLDKSRWVCYNGFSARERSEAYVRAAMTSISHPGHFVKPFFQISQTFFEP